MLVTTEKLPTLTRKGVKIKEKQKNIVIRGRSTILLKMTSTREIDTQRKGNNNKQDSNQRLQLLVTFGANNRPNKFTKKKR